uniref:Uncharacterized protein n=1 Tax=Romanomermis culicivorax TaxID=13658 RepID=A0A915IUL0_ROMCU
MAQTNLVNPKDQHCDKNSSTQHHCPPNFNSRLIKCTEATFVFVPRLCKAQISTIATLNDLKKLFRYCQLFKSNSLTVYPPSAS